MIARLHAVLAAIAVGAGALAASAGAPSPSPAADEVSAVQLAEWLRARRAGLAVVDLRAAAAEHLPGAQPPSALDALGADATVVVYADRDVDAATADALRRRWRRPGLLRLHGGIAAWNADVLFPTIRADAPAHQRRAFDARARLSRYFGGAPRVLEPGARSAPQRSRQGC